MAVEEKVIVDVRTKESGTEATADKFSKLQTRIRETRIELQRAAEAGDQANFNRLRGDLDDLEDQLAATTLRSKNLTDILGQIPGPLGDIAAQTGGALDQFKAFSQLSLSDLRLSVAEFGKDLSGALTTIGNISGITKVYTVINNALAASFVRLGIAEGAATAGARAFAVALTATGIGAIVVAIGALVAVFVNLANAEENANIAIKNYTESIQKQKDALNDLIESRGRASEIEIARLRQQGASEDQIAKVRLDNAKSNLTLRLQDKKFADEEVVRAEKELKLLEDRSKLNYSLGEFFGEMQTKQRQAREQLTAAQKQSIDAGIAIQQAELNLENIKADNSERERARVEQAKNEAIAASKAARDARIRDLDEIARSQRDAFLVTLSEQEAEEYAVNEKYINLIYQAVRYGKDTTLLEEARQIELNRIRVKYNEKELKDNEKYLKDREDKANAILKRIEEDEKSFLEAELYALQVLREFGLVSEIEYQDKLFNIKASYAEKDSELRDAELAGIAFFMGKVREYGQQYEAINAEIVQSYISLGDNIATVFSRTATLFEQGSTAAKVFGVLSVVANAASGIAQVVIENQKAQASYNKTISEGTAALASGTIKLTNPITAPLGVAEVAAGKAAIATSVAGKAASKLNAGIQIGTISATSAAQIAAILSAKKTSTASAGAAAGGGSSGGGLNIATPAIGAPQIGAGAIAQQGTIAGIVAGAIQGGQSGGRPIRAYVVGNDVTTQQQLERRLRTAARLGG